MLPFKVSIALIRMETLRALWLQLKDAYGLRDFIETGTYHGNTAVWAAAHFDQVLTIEYAQSIYDETVAKHSALANIKFLFGDSRLLLKNIIEELTRPAIFWLDSHWSGGKTYGRADECPLLEEIQVINTASYNHFLFIDDARLLTSPPPQPHQREQWPSIDAVIDALKSGRDKPYIVFIDDVVVAVPTSAKEFVARYCQDHNTKSWKATGGSLIGQVSRLFAQGVCQARDFTMSAWNRYVK